MFLLLIETGGNGLNQVRCATFLEDENMTLKYIMVTDFEKHWDRIPNKETSYPYRMLKGDTAGKVLINGTPTVFVKVDKDGLPIKAWNGRVEGIREEGSDIKFRVVLEFQIENLVQYANLK